MSTASGGIEHRVPRTPLFPLGRIVVTPGALRALTEAGRDPSEFLDRHAAGSWGDVSIEDAHENVVAIERGYRILSVYWCTPITKLYVITEADRSVTTLLLAEEY